MATNNCENSQSLSITEELHDCEVTEGKAAKFVCYAKGDDAIAVAWYKDEELIVESRHYSFFSELYTCSDNNDNSSSNTTNNNNNTTNNNDNDNNTTTTTTTTTTNNNTTNTTNNNNDNSSSSNNNNNNNNNKNCNTFKYVLVITRSTSEYEGRFTCELSNATSTVKSSAHLRLLSQVCDDRPTERDSEPEVFQRVTVQKEPVADYYTLMDVIGRGKFGVVHKCYDNTTKEEYAAKICKCRTSSQRSMNENEISILNTLHHPHIVRLIAAFEHGRQFVQVLELVSGGELFERLSEDELIAETDVIYYMEQILQATNYMHQQHILHLDLKPENILLVSKDTTQIKIIDFSLSCRLLENEYTKTLGGTRLFNPPEIIGYDPVSPASDMWSLGVIAYVLLAGFHPFDGDTDADISSNIMSCYWTFDDPVFDDVSVEAKDFIGRLLVKSPTDRSPSNECLQHDWIRSVQKTELTKKKIKTKKLVSFIARRNWKKSIAAIQATNLLKKVTGGHGEELVLTDNDADHLPSFDKDLDDEGSGEEVVLADNDTDHLTPTDKDLDDKGSGKELVLTDNDMDHPTSTDKDCDDESSGEVLATEQTASEVSQSNHVDKELGIENNMCMDTVLPLIVL